MPFDMSKPFPFTNGGVTQCSPRKPGVYGIYNKPDQKWIFIGCSEDIEGELYRHLNDQRILDCFPTHFAFEQCDDAESRLALALKLISELSPIYKG